MNLKVSKKIQKLKLNPNEVIDQKKCSKIKGGGYYCCVRNQWIGY